MSAVLQTPVQPMPAASTAQPASAANIRERFHAARRSGHRAIDAAAAIGVSEGQAVAAHAGAHDHALQAVPLRGPWVELLQALELCGPVMALTRTEGVVHEKVGVYQNISATGHMGLALGHEIDLRLFFGKWHAGFAVLEPAHKPENPPTQSLQFFDVHGTAVHKIFVRAETDREVFNDIVAQFTGADAVPTFTTAPVATPPAPDADCDAAGLLQAWSGMTDTHQFFGLINKFGVERQQAFRLVQGHFTERAAPSVVRSLLDEAALNGTSIMVFVSSSGCIQIHSGPVLRVEPMVTPTAQWLNVLDPGFNLHLREDLIANAWIVQKPTDDGVVTSVEVFDGKGALMAMFFGARKPGIPEQQAWRDIAARLPRLAAGGGAA